MTALRRNRGGRASRDKGNRLERAVVRLLQDHGLGAERVPLSGSAGGSYLGDLTVPILGRDLVIEAKSRANGFAQLYSWLDGRDVLIVKADRRDALVVLPLKLAAEIAVAAERVKSSKIQSFPVPKSTGKTASRHLGTR
jgi:Holliday junction resolvase